MTRPLKNEVPPPPDGQLMSLTNGTVWLVNRLYSRDNSSSVSTLVLARRVKTLRSNLAVSVNLLN